MAATKQERTEKKDATVKAATDAAPQAASEQTRAPGSGVQELLGAVTALMMESRQHQHLFLADMKWLVLPAVRLRQFRLFHRAGLPFAYVSWALVNAETEKRLTAGAGRLRPDEWKNGDSAWIIDLVAPFGGGEAVLKEVKEKALNGKPMKSRQIAPGGQGVAVVEW